MNRIAAARGALNAFGSISGSVQSFMDTLKGTRENLQRAFVACQILVKKSTKSRAAKESIYKSCKRKSVRAEKFADRTVQALTVMVSNILSKGSTWMTQTFLCRLFDI